MAYRGCEPRIEGIVQCTKRYRTILRKLKKCGGGGGAIFEPKTLSMYLKKDEKIKKKKLTEPGLEPTTSGLEKPALLSTRLNTIIAITNKSEKITISKQQLFKKNHVIVFFFNFTR